MTLQWIQCNTQHKGTRYIILLCWVTVKPFMPSVIMLSVVAPFRLCRKLRENKWKIQKDTGFAPSPGNIPFLVLPTSRCLPVYLSPFVSLFFNLPVYLSLFLSFSIAPQVPLPLFIFFFSSSVFLSCFLPFSLFLFLNLLSLITTCREV